MRIWIDCEWNGYSEWNGYRGDLISMALVAEDGAEWYEVLYCASPFGWVKENVMPKLMKEPVILFSMQNSLQKFLANYTEIHLIADWPEDIMHFCNLLITDPGKCLVHPKLTMEVCRIDSISALPHNALYDARANKNAYLGVPNDPG